jgi:hypothetical protein
VRLFQIEEPAGGPTDPDAPGAAVGIDASGDLAEVAMAVGGNAVMLADRDGFEHPLPVPPIAVTAAAWRELFEHLRLRAERALSRPVTHAVVVVAARPEPAAAVALLAAAGAAGVTILQLTTARELVPAAVPALAAAALAEDLAPRPGTEGG